ncbi:MAG TPA: hypothetical protein VEL07_19985 [Planctomycetota bacterium]|nr:hypothetical protein [Planctomycetota bacterium]
MSIPNPQVAGDPHDALLVRLDDALRPLEVAEAITQAGARLLGEHLGANRCAYADVEADEDTFNLTGDYNRDVPRSWDATASRSSATSAFA